MHINCPGQDFKGGIILGLSTSQVSGDDLAGFNKAGLIFGGFTNRILSSRNSLQLEIIYIFLQSSLFFSYHKDAHISE